MNKNYAGYQQILRKIELGLFKDYTKVFTEI